VPRSGALPGRAGAQARRVRRQQTTGPVATRWTLAGQLRPVLAGADGAPRASARNQSHDRVTPARQPPWLRPPADGDRISAPVGLHRCRRRPPPDGERRFGAPTPGPRVGYWRADALRTSAAARARL